MIVTMTSWAPVRALSTPGIAPHTAPPRNPNTTASGTWTIIGRPVNANEANTPKIAPRYSWPSPPMLNRPDRNPSATARPAKISGVADSRLSEIGRKARMSCALSPLPRAASIRPGSPSEPANRAP